MHYLTVLSRLKVPLTTNHQAAIANALMSLDRKVEGQQMRSKQNWSIRMAEIVSQLVSRYPTLADAIMRHPNFVSPGHVALVPSLGSSKRVPAAKAFLAGIGKKPNVVWTPQLVDLLSVLPPEDVFPLFRAQWNNLALREEVTIRLASRPEVVDRDRFMIGLASPRSDVVIASAGALLQLSPDQRSILPLMKAIRRLFLEPKEQALRSMLVTALNHEAGTSFSPQELGTQTPDLQKAFEPIFDWFRKHYPGLVRYLETSEGEDATNWPNVLSGVPWEKGDARRGEGLFVQRGCQTCHASASPVGPDLGGVARRFSPQDLFLEIAYPSRNIAPQYRPITYQTRTGQTYTGVPVFEAPDSVIVQTSAIETVRLAEQDIVSRAPANLSLMPVGLLNGLSRGELADLYAYIAQLQPAQ